MNPEFFRAFVSRAVVLQACRVASVVAPILLLVNHLPMVIESPLGGSTLRQLALNFMVPYMVSSYSSAKTVSRRAGE